MNQCKNVPPITIKNKDKWINVERQRWARQFNIPMRNDTPPGFPPMTLSTMRILCSLEVEAPEKMPLALDRLYAALWSPDSVRGADEAKADGKNFDIKNPEVVKALLTDEKALGKALTEKIIGGMADKEVKANLLKNTQKAFEEGAFGLPWFCCTNAEGKTEGFWGFDHLGQVVR